MITLICLYFSILYWPHKCAASRAEKLQQLGRNAPPLQRSVAKWAKKVGFEHNMKILDGEDNSAYITANKLSYSIAKKLVFTKIKEKLGLERCWGIGCGAAPLSRETFDYFLSLNIRLLEVYGMTETSGPQIGNSPGKQKIATIGRTIDGCRTKIFNPDPTTGKGKQTLS